jgi:hypothetical protein
VVERFERKLRGDDVLAVAVAVAGAGWTSEAVWGWKTEGTC